MVRELTDPPEASNQTLAAYSLSIYARQVKTLIVYDPIPEDQIRLTKPAPRQVKKNFPHHMAWVVLADSPENAERAGFFRALWMYPPTHGFVEWDVATCRFDRQTVIAMLAAIDHGSNEEDRYDRPLGTQEVVAR